MIKIFQNFKVFSKGFSLVELMLSTALLLMVATLIIPNPSTKQKVGKEARLIEVLDNTRRALLQYRSDYGYFPRAGETFSFLNYIYRREFGSGLDNHQPDVNIPLEKNRRSLIVVLETSLLEPQKPMTRTTFLRALDSFEYSGYRPPYLRGDGKSTAELVWDDYTEPRGFYLNPVTGRKSDWEVYMRCSLYNEASGDDPITDYPVNIIGNGKNGWYKLDMQVIKDSVPEPPVTGALDVGTDLGDSDYFFPPDQTAGDNTNTSWEITNIRFSPAGTTYGKKSYYRALNSEYGEYYYEW